MVAVVMVGVTPMEKQMERQDRLIQVAVVVGRILEAQHG
jgi:hypothetical protein